MAISKTTRFRVFKRDQFRCRYCGKSPPDVVLEVDHVLPASKGGTNQMCNLTTSCFDCNRGKSAELLERIPDSVTESMHIEVERYEQMKAFNKLLLKMRRETEATVDRLSDVWVTLKHGEVKASQFCITEPSRASVRMFLKSLAEAEVMEAMHIAFSRQDLVGDTWKYFCGICWNLIKDRRRDG